LAAPPPSSVAAHDRARAVPRRFGGVDDRITDRPFIGVDAFAGTRAAAIRLAGRIQQRVIAAPHVVAIDDGPVAVIDTATTREGPHQVPYGDSKVRRVAAVYSLALRRNPIPSGGS
jgi:hypothetical protein